MLRQLLTGSLLLLLCVALHVVMLALTVDFLKSHYADEVAVLSAAERILLICLGTAAALFGHTAQIWIWALVLKARGALSDLKDAVYFSLVTSTTLGYGDITLPARHRIFGAMAAVTGLITFGITTAFLVSLIAALMH